MDTVNLTRDSHASTHIIFLLACLTAATGSTCRAESEQQKDARIDIVHGAVNGVCIERNGHRLVIYGDPRGRWGTADMILFTHARRDVTWAGEPLANNGAQTVVPLGEAGQFTNTEDFWAGLWEKRFHDYSQQSTRLPATSMKFHRTVQGGDTLTWRDTPIRVLETPGYTRGAVSYFVETNGVRYGFVGDLIYGQGQLLDLYSLQDGVAEAKIGGYHGYAGRLGQLIESLRKVAAQKPDVLVPARGPVIQNPDAAISRLIERLQNAYKNYLSVSAGRWYFKQPYDILAARALGPSAQVPWMPYAGTIEKAPPSWIIPIHNSRLLLSQDRSGFMIDCGSKAILDQVRKLQRDGRLASIDGFFITHYHDDHTNWVNEFLDEYDCPAHVTPIMEDVLRQPGAHRLPAMTAKPITRLKVVPDGYRMKWKEFTLTFYDYPGQTLYHDAMLVEKDGGEKIFFIGDSFTPSGMDDYCLQNRNFLHDGMGYLYCLDLLTSRILSDALLINQHVLEPFRFERSQIDDMARAIEERTAILGDLFPWDNANYGIDEQWACIYPYGQDVSPGEQVDVAVRILNHSAESTTFAVRLNAPEGFESNPLRQIVMIGPGQQGEARFQLTVPPSPSSSIHVITADIRFDSWDLRHWCEGLLKSLQ